MIQHLKPLDRLVILSYLEGHDAAAISEITGLSLGNVAVKIYCTFRSVEFGNTDISLKRIRSVRPGFARAEDDEVVRPHLPMAIP
jgi:hypothetical protein